MANKYKQALKSAKDALKASQAILNTLDGEIQTVQSRLQLLNKKKHKTANDNEKIKAQAQLLQGFQENLAIEQQVYAGLETELAEVQAKYDAEEARKK